MLLSRRYFKRREPQKSAKSVYIFCEGRRTEYQYFIFFEGFDSKIRIEVYPLKENDDNSPLGLWNIAEGCLIRTTNNPNPKYELLIGDEVWFVLDTDKDKTESRKIPLLKLRENCAKQNWNTAESNPCFEVWLYYHFSENKPNFKGMEVSANWKSYLNNSIKGGFDPRKHPFFIKTAIKNSEKNFNKIDQIPSVGSTEVFMLGNSIFPLIEKRISTLFLD